MITVPHARMLTRYNAWSNTLWYDAIAALPAGEALKPRTSLFKNMVHMLNHNYVIDRIFQAHLEGREHGYSARNTPDHPPLAGRVRSGPRLRRARRRRPALARLPPEGI